MAFFSNEILALLSSNNTLEFWKFNYKRRSLMSKKTLIKTISLNHFDTLTAAKRICKKLDFSPDKQWLLVGLDNKCIIIPTPLELSYGVKTTNQIFTAYYCLRNTKEMDILTDIIQIIIGTMLDCSHNP